MTDIFRKTAVYVNKGSYTSGNITSLITKKLREKLIGLSDLDLRSQLVPQFSQLESFLPDINTAIFTYKSNITSKHRLTLIKMEKPVVFSAGDELSADIIFILSSPTGQIGESLSILSSLSRLLRNNNIIEKIRGADTQDAIRALLWEEETARHAA